MTPGARVQAAIEILDEILAGTPAEKALTSWARARRFAGSKDRAAIRDHVFDALRMLRSAAWTGGCKRDPVAGDGRAVMAGLTCQQGLDVEALFSGVGYAPAPSETAPAVDPDMPDVVRRDIPDWLLPILRADLGDALDATLDALRHRAPVFLRANTAKTTRDDLARVLASEGVTATPSDVSRTALQVAGAPRGLTNLPSFQDGLWELQDAGSQALVDRVPLAPSARVLDLCAGGGGKALALAARTGNAVWVHDANAARMADIPARTARAGARLTPVTDPETAAPFDVVVADVPCSGTGSWRRAADAKWRLTPDRLAELGTLQARILDRAISLTRPGGVIVYMTCSMLGQENEQVVEGALRRHAGLRLSNQWSILPTAQGPDGFHLSAILRDT